MSESLTERPEMRRNFRHLLSRREKVPRCTSTTVPASRNLGIWEGASHGSPTLAKQEPAVNKADRREPTQTATNRNRASSQPFSLYPSPPTSSASPPFTASLSLLLPLHFFNCILLLVTISTYSCMLTENCVVLQLPLPSHSARPSGPSSPCIIRHSI